MATNKFNFDRILRRVQETSYSAQQDISVTRLSPGMLCRTSEFKSEPTFFYLITDLRKDCCEVIPGSLDGLMAGPEDIILPVSVLGQYIFLSMNLAGTLPQTALGKVFAVLDDDVYHNVLDSLLIFRTKAAKDTSSFPFALPYISNNDSRIPYHSRLSAFVQRAKAALITEKEFSFSAKITEWFRTELQPIFDIPVLAFAAGEERKNPSAICQVILAVNHIAKSPGTASIEYSPVEQILVINFFDQNGNEDPVHFEGWQVVKEDGIALGTVKNGILRVDNLPNFNGRCCVINPSRQIFVFRRLEN